MAARHSWIAELLGEQWRPEGDGIYRFVGGQRASAPGEPTETLATAPWPEERDGAGTPPTGAGRSPLPWRRS